MAVVDSGLKSRMKVICNEYNKEQLHCTCILNQTCATCCSTKSETAWCTLLWWVTQIRLFGMVSTLNKNYKAANQNLSYRNIKQILCYITANQILPYGNTEHILCYITANQILPYGNSELILCYIAANQILPYGNTEHVLCYITANQIPAVVGSCSFMVSKSFGSGFSFVFGFSFVIHLWLQLRSPIKATAL